MSVWVPDLQTASATLRPCEVRKYHWPKPVITQGHHIHPVFLQNRLFGRIVDNELLWACGNDHDSIHAWLYWLLRERSKPDRDPGRLVKDVAEVSFSWYQENGGASLKR